jgi:hypothetical protein
MFQAKWLKSTRSALAVCVALGGLAACATGAPSGNSTARSSGGSPPSDCILGGNVRDYTALDNRNLILYGTGNRPYHVVLATPAIDLEREFSIGVYDGDAALGGVSRICPYGGDAIIIDGPITERIPIRSIEQIDDVGVEALLVRFGKADAADDDEVTVTEIQ